MRNRLHFPWLYCTIFLLFFRTDELRSAEPNETFSTSTVLSPETFSVSDSLTPGAHIRADTLLGVRNALGVITLTDDNSSTLGDGSASGVTNIPTNSGPIAFAVSGTGDTDFSGDHTESGSYDVEIEVFDSLGSLVASFFTGVQTLHTGGVDNYSFTGTTDWVGGTYRANIDNGLSDPTGGDVDFFTFAGLPAGASFSAETSDPSSTINTFMFFYDSSGTVISADDNSGDGQFSLINGTVPGDGQLSFAITGFGDTAREGAHSVDGTYTLSLEIDTGIIADFNNSGVVDGNDLEVWQNSFGVNAGGDADGDSDSDGNDFLVWQRQLGAEIAVVSAINVPEPSSAILFLLGATALMSSTCCARRKRPI